MLLIENPPKMVYDDAGELIEAILSAQDYFAYLRVVAAESDWEALPPHLQDAIDRFMIDEVRDEQTAVFDLEEVLSAV